VQGRTWAGAAEAALAARERGHEYSPFDAR
jgi:hypothetical protein